MKRSFSCASLLLLAALSVAQSRWSSATVGAANLDLGNQLGVLDSNRSGSGGYVDVSVTRDFSGVDAGLAPQTMTFQGFASGQSNYGRLKTTAYGTVTNTYYNPRENKPYYYPVDTDEDGEADYFETDENGSPDAFTAYAYAGFEDVLSFGQGANAGYKAQYVFFVDGVASGTDVYAYLHAKIGENDQETLTVDLSGGKVAQYLTTQKYEINALMQQTAEIDFTTQFNPSINDYFYPEGSTVSGSLMFSSTVTLTGINIYDLDDNLVSGISIMGASGTSYPLQAVPEPASVAALGLGALALLRRRQR